MTEGGIYFGLSEDGYHADPALSSSGIKTILASPEDYWWQSAMNPDRPTDDDTEAKYWGRAYHKRILEGKAAFDAAYCAALDPVDFPDALRTADDIRAELKARGKKVGGNKDELIVRAQAEMPDCQLWDVMREDYAQANAGRGMLSRETIARLELAAAYIEKHPDLGRCFTGGAPEVSIFWHEEGIPMKARLDYLKAKAQIDLKTFSNPQGKPIDKAIVHAVASGRYHVQAAVHSEAARRAVDFVREGRVFGDCDKDVLRRIAQNEERAFIFVFQKTVGAPVALAKELRKGSIFQCGRLAMEQGMTIWKKCRDTFGDGPWILPRKIIEFDDAEFPAWTTEV